MKFAVTVEQVIEVELDEARFTPDFMNEFRASFYDFQTLADHARHLGQLYARGIAQGYASEFIEGYGPAMDFHIKFRDVDMQVDVDTLPNDDEDNP